MKKRVLIGIISNRRSAPSYFYRSLFELIDFSKSNGINIHIQEFSSVSVEQMRNSCCEFAIENGFDYVFMLDDDMKYPRDSLYKLLQHNLDFVVGSATQRYSPFHPTQYKDANSYNFKDESNRVFINKKDNELISIGSTGVVGALISVEMIKKMERPYFRIEHLKDSGGVIGSDIYFCRNVGKIGGEIYLDPTINYQHEILAFSDSFGIKVN